MSRSYRLRDSTTRPFLPLLLVPCRSLIRVIKPRFHTEDPYTSYMKALSRPAIRIPPFAPPLCPSS